MKCNDIKLLLMDFLYDEIGEEDKKVLQNHLSQCVACREEYQSLKETSNTLHQLEDIEPDLNLVFVSEEKSIWSGLKEKFAFSPKKLGYGFAVGIVAVMLLLSIMNAEINYEAGKFSMKVSLLPRKAAQQPKDLTNENERFAQLQQQTLQLMNRLIKQSEENQRQEFMAALAQFSRDYENRRTQDLNLVGAGLGEIEKNIYSRIQRKTNSQFNHLIRYIDAKQGRK